EEKLPGPERPGPGPLPDREKPSEALQRLVEIGPDALPFLLEALEDERPTKRRWARADGSPGFRDRLTGNLLNPLERRILSEKPAREDDGDLGRPKRLYALTIGDVCFVAIGQIVGRPYRVVFEFPPSSRGHVIVKSPVESKVLREQV